MHAAPDADDNDQERSSYSLQGPPASSMNVTISSGVSAMHVMSHGLCWLTHLREAGCRRPRAALPVSRSESADRDGEAAAIL